MNKILVICGHTATGKTSLALRLSKKFNGEIISADSRQVYKGMDIGTGKDIPSAFKLKLSNFDSSISFYTDNKTYIWGYDLVNFWEEFSVSKYVEVVKKILANVYLRKKLPILVGGTGFYIKAVIDGFDTLHVPKDESLRLSLRNKGARELYEILKSKDFDKAFLLNESDRKNPRRLIRAIEVVDWKSRKGSFGNDKTIKYNSLFIGLYLPKDKLNKVIEKRVTERLKMGFESEVNKLVSQGFNLSLQSSLSIGYSQWLKFVRGEISREQAIQEWMSQEKSYSKRQMMWFKKDKRIKWFNVSNPKYISKVEELIRKWHNSV